MSEITHFDFSSKKPKSIPVTSPSGENLVLMQAPIGAVMAYRDALAASGKLTEKADGTVEVTEIKGLARVNFVLLANCLLRCDTEGNPIRIGGAFIPLGEAALATWDGQTYDPMIDWVREASPELFGNKEKTPDPKEPQPTSEAISSTQNPSANPLMS